MHNLIGLQQGIDRYGRPAIIWMCNCGRKGSGSQTSPEARAGHSKHARGRARKAGGLQPRRIRLRDW